MDGIVISSNNHNGDNMKLIINNEKIYNKLLDIEKHIIETNGKVKLNRWIATTAITIAIALLGFLCSPLVTAMEGLI